ncbi:MAG: ATP-binding protein [Bdellovibrionales bacterium]|nr:ATP-binding protein [Bdellovibrionales bacterium]
MYPRLVNLPILLEKKSHFLFGPRATGKTTLIEKTLPDAQVVDLLHAQTFSRLVRNPSVLEELITDTKKLVVIDEVQKLPSILDEVHRLIQKKKIRFLLTGSSARKLRHGGANLLAGRAREARLFPLVSAELGEIDLLRILSNGGLPDIYDSDLPDEDLAAYVDTYLREEIKAEAVTRNVSAFVEFLDALALSNGQELNFESFASDLQVSSGTVKNYLQIIEDTLVGFQLPGFTKTKKRKAISRAKYFLFDLGVRRHLARESTIQMGSKSFGDAFEHFIILEVYAWNWYGRHFLPLSYWRSTSQYEVDLIIGDTAAIEIKATKQVQDRHLKGLRALREEGIVKKFFVVSQDPDKRVTSDGIEIYPWRYFLEELWNKRVSMPGFFLKK